MTIKITPMNISDYDQIYSLWKNTQGMGLHDDVDSKKGIARFLRHNPGLNFVAKDAGKVVATLLCSYDGRRGHLLHLAVDKSYRKQGIAKKLVYKVLNRLKKIKVHTCTLFALSKNRKGRDFWKHTGWKERPDVIMFSKSI
ncbi:MAG: GNAT family N-acetyltransferase [Phycisphaerales bacterium]